MTNQVGIDMNSDSEGDELLQYNPNRLLDTLIENLRLKNDAALSRALEVAPPVISKNPSPPPASRRFAADPHARSKRPVDP